MFKTNVSLKHQLTITIFKQQKKYYKMKTSKITKETVLARLTKYGWNAENAKIYIDRHFDYAVSKYSTLKTVCECIITIN